MDTLYFDSLQFLYHAALAVLVGGAIVQGGPSRRYDQLAGVALFVVVVTSGLKLFTFEDADVGPRLVVRWVAIAVMAAATLYANAWAGSVARAFRAQVPDFDDLPETSAARREYVGLARSAARAMRVIVVSGLVALFLS